MPYKPLPRKQFEKYIKFLGWKLEKGSIDWNLYNERGNFICSIIISHGNTKTEVVASSVKKVEKFVLDKGLTWPPKKKSKSI